MQTNSKPGLKNRGDCPELLQDYAQKLAEFFEVQYASAIVDKMSSEISQSNFKGITSISKIYMERCQQLSAKFSALLSLEDKERGQWLYIASVFFRVVGLWAVWNQNAFITSGLTEKTKGVAKIYLENYLIGQELSALKTEVGKLPGKFNKLNTFNFKDAIQYLDDFLSPLLMMQMKENISKYENHKDALDSKGLQGHNVETIFSEIDSSQNLIEMIVSKQIGY